MSGQEEGRSSANGSACGGSLNHQRSRAALLSDARKGQGRHPILCPLVPAFASLGSSEGSQHGPFSSVAQLCPTLCDPMDCRAIS